ncbi:hypothetical protein ABFS82_05G020900 [Erythranthe guttata]|uniref:Uncharacterized protein n=1 Tax=Erythranthe guttata TaxID=4155 RepID=A0A022Q7P6_ERYGU|nr:PREDICTED: uncharacterized protein LOC105974721 [Erythranthe guttata]EYU22540.1 hypothetical protein MIMGU_mgv1a004532mg [Erythranthe guttata]|eukprot:XP_012855313.1 PREDICTED: uncharacterized protein LOC105974721 [Erythranthe guttata]
MSKSPWGNVGNWAAEAERAEAEEREAAAAQPPPVSFPSLKESVSTAKLKKKTKMNLAEFMMQQSTDSGSLRLPTGPKERSPDEMQHGRLGGGFSNYGSRTGSSGPNSGRTGNYEGRRSYGYEDDDRRGSLPQSRVSEFDQPSRADEVDNWASMKRQTLPDERDSRQARPGGKYSSLGGGVGSGAASRADEVDNWASSKKPISHTQPQTRSSSFVSGFSRPDSDRWTRNEPEQKLSSNPPKNEVETPVKVNRPNPFGVARPREEVLAEKGLDWKKLDLDIESKKQQSSVTGGSSRPTSSQSSRSETPMGEVTVKQKPKVNPFGDAKPREVLLEEKGLDWKKIDLELEHKRVDRPETEEEKNLKEEIEHLKNELQQKSGEEQTSVQDLILQKQQHLEVLVHQLDDKVRYSQKIFERQNSRPPSRPGSHDGPRSGFPERPSSGPRPYEDPRSGFHERPRSRPGAYEENNRSVYPQRSSITHGAYQEQSRGGNYNERPSSRGSTDSWTRTTFEGGNRDVDRSGSRW